MCGVIVVNAGRSQSTNLGRDSYVMIIPGYRHNCLKFYQLPNSNLFTHRLLFFSREATSQTYFPGSLSHIICLCDLFSFSFILRSTKQKIQKYLGAIYFIWRSIYQSTTILSHVRLPISGAATRKGLTAPFTRRVARSCYLCAGVVYVVLLGSPTGSITLVSHLRLIPTAVVLHHPFLFGEIPM